MKRSALIIGLLTWLALSCTASVRAQDKVKYVDHKTGKEVDPAGAIEQETEAGITLKQGLTTNLIPVADIHRVVYNLANVTEVDYGLPFRRGENALRPKNAAERRTILWGPVVD